MNSNEKIEAMMLQCAVSECQTPLRAVIDRCRVLDDFATQQASEGVERAIVLGLVGAAFDKYVEPLIRSYDPPGPDGIYVQAARWLACYLAMRGYDMVKK